MTTPAPASSSFVKDYVDATAPVGTFLTGFRFIVAIIIFIILLGIAIHLYFFRAKNNHHTESINAKVINSNCVQNVGCDVILEYTVGSNKYQTPFRSSVQVMTGQMMSIYYDPNNPTDISQDSPGTDKIAAWILLGLGLLIVGGTYLSYWLSKTYPAYASFETTATGASMISSAFSR
jgi:hypothetical protein